MTLLEFTVHRALEKTETPLRGIYRGSPQRSTLRPSTETILRAFIGIALIGIPHQNLVQRVLPRCRTLKPAS